MKNILKKVLSLVCVLTLISSLFCVNASAKVSNSNEIKSIGNTENFQIQSVEFNDNGKLNLSADNKSIRKTSASQNIWKINDSVFVGNGNLTSSVDLYVVTTAKDTTAFLKLGSSNTNLLAVLYNVNSDGTLGNSTGFGTLAGKNDVCGILKAGTYVIAIGSADGTQRGSYNLMWNCANDSGAHAIIDKTTDLSRVVLFYNNNNIQSNGINLIKDLKWEEHETWYTDYGYSARDMVIDTINSNGTFLGAFETSAPYSTNKALFIQVNQGSWLYFNSYYQNIDGNVQHIMNYFDPSGKETPRTLGKSPDDFTYGQHYIVIDLNKFAVIDFLSPFNYHYTKQGGRTYSLSNIVELK